MLRVTQSILHLSLATALIFGVAVPSLAVSAESSQEKSVLVLTANKITHKVSVVLPENWSVAPSTFKNARSLIGLDPGASASPSNEIRVYLEPRLDHADALNQIRELAAAVPSDSKTIIEVAGWPAMRINQVEEWPQPSQGPSYPYSEVLRIHLYIAVKDTLFVATATLPPDAGSELIQQVNAITSSFSFESIGNSDALKQDLDFLQAEITPDSGPDSGKISGDTAVKTSVFTAPSTAGEPTSGAVAGSNIRIDAVGFGELEIAASPDGVNVVVGLQGRRFVSSNNGGNSFSNAGIVGSGNGDPSIAIAQSGDFYLSWIDVACGSNYLTFDVGTQPPQPFGYDCTGIARSTNNGVTFLTNTVNPAVACIGFDHGGGMHPAGACFPDQEHIAADPLNAGTGGGDQIYATWRNFTRTSQDAGLACSQDSGITWTAPISLGPGSFFPRITVGQDGSVYVAAYAGVLYKLWKFDSCASGLNLQPGFPVNVAFRRPYGCPFPGHDRCDQNPSSQTVAVDDTNPNHIYYAYAQDDVEAQNRYSTVFVRDSLDGGLTWPSNRVITANSGVDARRIMPWMCTTNGDAVLTWFEQAAALPNDSTHYVGAQIGLNSINNLVARDVFTISEVPDNWCDSGWPCGTRLAPGASESCPKQPQLAGFCGDAIKDTPDSGIRCDFSDENAVPGTYCPQPYADSGNNEFCLAGGGCPKYGDYNGNDCVGYTLHAAWASASSPPGVPGPNTPTNTGVLYSAVTLNKPPVCDANGPYTAECGMPTSLNGTGSFDPDGAGPLNYKWTGPFTPSPTTGATPSVIFPAPLGIKSINLTVNDIDQLTDSCTAQVTVADTIPPVISCNTPATITPPDVPVSFTATATDMCDADPNVDITVFDCFKFTKKGKQIDKRESCEVTIAGDTVTILDSGGAGDHIKWKVLATDGAGNQSDSFCEIIVAKPEQ